VATKGMTDRKLQGQMRHNERVVGDAERAAARVDEWLLPESAGQLEAEGMERTWRFAQVKFPAWTLGGKRRGGVLKLVFKVERSSLPGGGGGRDGGHNGRALALHSHAFGYTCLQAKG